MKKILPILLIAALSGCAVSMAAKTKGVKAAEAQKEASAPEPLATLSFTPPRELH